MITATKPTCSRCRSRLTRDTWCSGVAYYCATCYPDHEYVFAHGITGAPEERSHAAQVTGN